MRVALLTREYPPEVYGGAGVHVEYLARELARLEDVTVHGWGADRADAAPPVVGHRPGTRSAGGAPHLAALRAMSIDLAMAAGAEGAERRAQPHLVREPRRPPGEADLRHPARRDRALASSRCGRGRPSSSAAATRSRAGARGPRWRPPTRSSRSRRACARHPRAPTRRSIRSASQVIYNGIDADEYAPDPDTDVLERYGIDPDAPSVVFVGRITRQKGVPYLLRGGARASTRRRSSCSAPARPTRPRSAPRSSARVERAASRRATAWSGSSEMLPKPERDPAPQPRDGVRLPVDLRAARDRQPRGDGLRGGGRRHRDRRDPRGRRRRRDRPAGAVRAGDDGTREPRDPRRVRRATSRSASTSWSRDPTRAEAMGRAGRAARGRATSPGRDRRADRSSTVPSRRRNEGRGGYAPAA